MSPNRYSRVNAVIQATALALPVLLVAVAAGSRAGLAFALSLAAVWLAARHISRRRG